MLLMNNLKLVTTENFGGENDNSQGIAPCDFWVDKNGEYLVTREQIGKALRYSNPSKAIEKIHLRHKDRLDKYSYLIKSEICRSPQSVEVYKKEDFTLVRVLWKYADGVINLLLMIL